MKMEVHMMTNNEKWTKQFGEHECRLEWTRARQTPSKQADFEVHSHYLKKYIKPGDRVLEIGPGPGHYTQVLAEIGARVVIVDISSVQLELNRQCAARYGFGHSVVDWVRHDMRDMSTFITGTFDAVVCFGALNCVMENRDDAIDELLRVVKPGGIVLLGVMSLWGTLHAHLPEAINATSEAENIAMTKTGDLCPQTYENCVEPRHLFTSQELRELLDRHNVVVLTLSASNSLATAWNDRLADVQADEAKWRQLVNLEIQASSQPGCLDTGTNIIGVVQKRLR
jgi:ubiquinone/menaquinone biosynthesis C-methylase UbiE